MPIEFPCQQCNKLLRTPDESAGKQAKCPECGLIQAVPANPQEGLGEKTSAAKPSTPLANPFAESQTPQPNAAGDRVEDYNPYASPIETKPTISPGKAGSLQHSKISLEDVLTRLFEVFKKHLGPCLLFGLVLLGINIGTNIVVQVGQGVGQAIGEPAVLVVFSLVTQLISFLVQTFVQIGACMFGLRLVRHDQPEVGLVFQGGRFFGQGILYTFLLGLMFLGIFMVAVVPGVAIMASGNQEIGIVAILAGIAVAAPLVIYLAMRFYLGMFFIVDQNMGCMDALKASTEYMRGNMLHAFIAGLALAAICTPLICTCVGILVVFPAQPLLMTIVYLRATGQPVPGAIQ